MNQQHAQEVPEIMEINRPGILNKQQIKKLMRDGIISNCFEDDIDYSSFDLHISDKGWKLDAGLKGRAGKRLQNIINNANKSKLGVKRIKIPQSGKKITVGETYLFEIIEKTNLEIGYFGQGTGRSSIGRLDVLTRLLVDNEERYDVVSDGYRNLYVEITPLSFDVVVFPELPIYQLRLAYGRFEELRLQNNTVKLWKDLLMDENGDNLSGITQTHLRLCLRPDQVKGLDGDAIAFKAKRDVPIPIALNAKDEYYPEDFWDIQYEKYKIGNENVLEIKKDDFYILRSLERFKMHSDIAVYGIAMTEEVGELRIHHAGFIHPFFGVNRKNDNKGAPLIFEVRGHDVPMYLMHEDVMAELKYYPMSEDAIPDPMTEEKTEEYSNQELKLSKVFKNWGKK